MQGAWRAEREFRNWRIKALPVFSDEEKAALHRARFCRQRTAAGVFELLAWTQQRLVPDHPQAFHHGKFVQVSDESLKGKWSVLIFMPAAFTFNCPTEVEDAADNYAEFQKAGAEVYIVTTDTHFSHKVWHETSPAVGKSRFPLVGDPTHQLTRAFGVHIDAEGLALRGTFIINPEGVIKTMEVHDNAIARDVKETLRKLKAAQFVANNPGQVCPAKWNEGAKTLTPSLDLVGKI